MIRLEKVTKRFARHGLPAITALDCVDFQVQSGEFVIVVGESGSGKSTLLFTIGTMMKPSEGKVYLQESDVYEFSQAERAEIRRSKIGFLFQTFNLMPYLSAVDNVALPAILSGKPRRSARHLARERLAWVGLSDRFGHQPGELSVGERQRVALCRALINDPDLLLADEPTGNLDPDRTDQVMDLLFGLNKDGLAIVMATHDVQLEKYGNRRVTIRDSCIIDDIKIQEYVEGKSA